MKRQRGYLTLIGLIVVIAIIAIVTATYYGSPIGEPREDGVGNTLLGSSVAKARDEECKSNLRQIRGLVQVAQIGDEKVQSLSELGAESKSVRCPIGGEGYVLDVEEQKVTCPHPGHQAY